MMNTMCLGCSRKHLETIDSNVSEIGKIDTHACFAFSTLIDSSWRGVVAQPVALLTRPVAVFVRAYASGIVEEKRIFKVF